MGFKMKLSNNIVDFDITLRDEQYIISCYRSGCIGFVFLDYFLITKVSLSQMIYCCHR